MRYENTPDQDEIFGDSERQTQRPCSSRVETEEATYHNAVSLDMPVTQNPDSNQ